MTRVFVAKFSEHHVHISRSRCRVGISNVESRALILNSQSINHLSTTNSLFLPFLPQTLQLLKLSQKDFSVVPCLSSARCPPKIKESYYFSCLAIMSIKCARIYILGFLRP